MMTARRAAKGPYSNTGPLCHFGTQPDLFPGALSAVIAERVRVSPLIFLPDEGEPLDLRAMWAASPLFGEHWLSDDTPQDAWDRWLAKEITWSEYVAIVERRERNARAVA